MLIENTRKSLRSQMMQMEVGAVLEAGRSYKGVTVRNYASDLGREYGRTYSTHYNREKGHYEITRTA